MKERKKKEKKTVYSPGNRRPALLLAWWADHQRSSRLGVLAQLGAAAQFGPSQPEPAAAPSLPPCFAGKWDPAVGCFSKLT
jgi:hypothetical protein